MSLPVFDGVEMAAHVAEDASRQINEQVYRGWMDGNPYQTIAEGYGQMMAYLDQETFDSLTDETRKQLARALNLEKGEQPTFEMLQNQQKQLEALARDAAARKAAMARMASSTDHMASAEAPHVQDGDVTVSDDPLAFDEIAETLENLRQSELAKLEDQDEAKASEPRTSGYAQKPNHRFQQALKKLGRFETLPGHPGVTRVPGDLVMKLLTEENGATPEQRGIIRELERLKAIPEGAVFYFGEARDLEALRDAEYPSFPKSPIQLGQTTTSGLVTFITNPSPETLVHELLHGFTARTLRDHFTNPERSPEHVRFAVERLQELRQEFLSLVPDTDVPADRVSALEVLRTSYDSLRAVIMPNSASKILSSCPRNRQQAKVKAVMSNVAGQSLP